MPCPALSIVEEVYNRVVLAGITGIDAGSTFRRRQPERRKSDPDRICVICVGREKVHSRTNQTVKIEYPVLVVLSDKGALEVPALTEWEHEARFAARLALWASFLLGPTGIVRHCDYDSSPDFTALGFEQSIKVSGQLFTYRTEETQTP